MTRTAGQPVIAVQKCLDNLLSQAQGREYEISAVGTTGSGRNLAGALVGADVIKNEITAHAVAASSAVPGVQTILEIGGQDSKIIILRDGIVTDFVWCGAYLSGQGQELMLRCNITCGDASSYLPRSEPSSRDRVMLSNDSC